MRNICFLNSITFWGGGEKLNLEYAAEFQKKQYNVVMLSRFNSPLWKKASNQGIKMYPIRVKNLSFLNPLIIIKLGIFYNRHKIDTVIFSNSQDLKVGSISAKLAGVKNIVYYRSIAVPIRANLINRMIFKSILTHIVANSDETKRTILQSLGKHINPEAVKTIYYGVDLNKLNGNKSDVLKEIKDKGHGIILGNAGRLTTQKGQQYLIEIAKKLIAKQIDFTLFIAGTGELFEELEASIVKHDLQQHVILLGFVEDMERFMNSIDIFLLTSMWEGFGYVLVEAMIKSKPVVAFNMTSNPEVVLADKTGFLVDHPDLEMFANKVEMLANNEELRTQMGKVASESVYERFALEDRVTELESYIIKKNNA